MHDSTNGGYQALIGTQRLDTIAPGAANMTTKLCFFGTFLVGLLFGPRYRWLDQSAPVGAELFIEHCHHKESNPVGVTFSF
ncbi:MAG TPA: hypothetical protein DEP53_15165 [Bacteroidetes bacterium]|nr:hypothetical protein [Bacteroidota bacterium]